MAIQKSPKNRGERWGVKKFFFPKIAESRDPNPVGTGFGEIGENFLEFSIFSARTNFRAAGLRKIFARKYFKFGAR